MIPVFCHFLLDATPWCSGTRVKRVELSTWIERYRVTSASRFLSESTVTLAQMGLLTLHCPADTKGWTRTTMFPAVAASPSRTVGFCGYRSSGLHTRKGGFCERVTRGSPVETPSVWTYINPFRIIFDFQPLP